MTTILELYSNVLVALTEAEDMLKRCKVSYAPLVKKLVKGIQNDVDEVEKAAGKLKDILNKYQGEELNGNALTEEELKELQEDIDG